MTSLLTTPLSEATARAERALHEAAPDLVEPFREALPRAVDAVGRRLLGALLREGITEPGTVRHAGHRYGFGRVEIVEAVTTEPAALVPGGDGADRVAAELTDATVNLALAYARRPAIERRMRATGAPNVLGLAGGTDADQGVRALERLSTEGHNLHPCGRTRLGWTVPDLLAHDLETETTEVGFVAVRRDTYVGDDLAAHVDLPGGPAGYAVAPVHAWQLDSLLRHRYADLFADRTLVALDARWPAAPTTALRTLLVAGRYLKVSLDIQITSTRRSISVASTRNGPAISAVLAKAIADEPACARLLPLAETAGAALAGSRDVSVIVREGLAGRLEPGEVAVPGSALPARSPLTGDTVLSELVDAYARRRGLGQPAEAGLKFLGEYARLLLPPVLTLAARYGIGLEAHLQNCIPTFVDGIPHRLALRDFAGLRIHPPRLKLPLTLWPGSVVASGDPDVMRSKVAYTAIQAHLGELMVGLVRSHGVAEPDAWATVRDVVDECYDDLAGGGTARANDARGAAGRANDAHSAAGRANDARGDHAFLTAATVPHKALLRMRLVGSGDVYVPVPNPLHR